MRILILAIFSILAIAFPAMAQEESVISPSSSLYTIWTIVQPIVVTLASVIGPAIAVWLAAQVSRLLSVTDEVKRKELEERLRNALHEAASNGLKYALSKYGLGSAASIATALASPTTVEAAIQYIRDKNPEAAAAFNLRDEDLKQIVLSKVPDVTAIVEKPQ